ncbi:beta strand repeat-containing protein [Fimbriiglobus ruber]|uniref:Fibronectin type III domain protein n=1 Tax=Fimbriiglobus ruber TaxID=1908690 RepID=A0A225DJX8_9BACT|nr:right-handed parallel beta-helix repeat-containing protein [Fimbriiglobus ruber]OWK39974.1 Fibronectin type III domain protein [Fimbriiglobus ruber]
MAFEPLEDKLAPAVFTVSSLADTSTAGTFRWAITQANMTAGTDTITFGVAGTINVTTALPTITESVTVDGTTTPGYTGKPLVEVAGASAGSGANGLTITTTGVTVRGLAIDQFTGSEIAITGTAATGNVISGNYIGINLAGTAGFSSGGNGVFIGGGASNNVIGTDGNGTNDAAERNVISGNAGSGVYITDVGTKNNIIAGNLIGTNAAGTAVVKNNLIGVWVISGASGTRIGTDGNGISDDKEGNVISGNGAQGVAVEGVGSDGTMIAGNFIGTNSASAALGNGSQGIALRYGPANTRIGTDGSNDAFNASERNVISGNADIGVLIQTPNWTGAIPATPTTGTAVAGNYIGTNVAGTTALANGQAGIQIASGATNTRIGTDGNGIKDDTEVNVVSGNNSDGVQIIGTGTTGVVVAGNFLGTNAAGTAAIANAFAGVALFGGAAGNRIGTDGSSDAFNTNERNIISGNASNGVYISGANNNVVAGNYIGTNAAGTAAVANKVVGIDVGGGAVGNRIGTDGSNDTFNATEANVISGNTDEGVVVEGSGTDKTVVAGNYIGLNAAGTTALANLAGISVRYGATNTLIGTDGSNDAFNATERNIISGNTNYGVLVQTPNYDGTLPVGGATTSDTVIAGNYIGTNAAGTAGLIAGGGGDGIRILSGAKNTHVGTYGDGTPGDASRRNVISGNFDCGIIINGAGTDGTVIAGNFVGTDATGMAPVLVPFNGSNIDSSGAFGGIQIVNGATNTRIGTAGQATAPGSDALERNIISGNRGVGIYAEDLGQSSVPISGNPIAPNNVTIAGNFIGTNATGTAAIPNGSANGGGDDGNSINGVTVRVNGVIIGTNSDGSAGDTDEGNLISGNVGVGIESWGGGARIAGNRVGTDVTGTAAIGNGISGISVGGSNTIVGTNGDGILDGIEGNLVSGNKDGGIGLGAPSARVSGNYIGTDVTGTKALGNQDDGIGMDSAFASNSIIGTNGDGVSDDLERNIISGNSGSGVVLSQATDVGLGTGIRISGNYIGTDVTGKKALGNRGVGIQLGEIQLGINDGDGVTSNIIIGTNGDGAFDDHERNIISGNLGDGINIFQIAVNDVIAGNYIGTDVSGTVALGNTGDGVHIDYGATFTNNIVPDPSLVGTFVGTNGDGSPGDAAEGNVISGNGKNGVYISRYSQNEVFGNIGFTATRVAGNYIGLNAAGTAAIPNSLSDGGAGVDIDAYTESVTVGTNGDGVSDALERNVIVSEGDGIDVSFTWTLIPEDRNRISGNYIGTNAAGGPLPSPFNSLGLWNRYGIVLEPGAGPNLIGTDVNGVSDALEANVIGGCVDDGIIVKSFNHPLDAMNSLRAPFDNEIVGNYIGANPAGTAIGNLGNGITIGDSSGGADSVATLVRGNTIANNSQSGIFLATSSTPADVNYGITLSQNNIFDNGLLGIDIAGGPANARNPNDLLDVDTNLPNRGQNFPVLGIGTRNASATTSSVTGSLNSRANRGYRIEFFANTSSDAVSTQAELYLGSSDVTTDASGNASYTFTFATSLLPTSAYRYVVATATDLDPTDPDGTSEISLPVLLAAPISVAAPTSQVISESGNVVFHGATAFTLTEGPVTAGTFTTVVTATHGTATLDAAAVAANGLTVSGNGTASVRVSGPIAPLKAFFSTTGFRFDPTPYYSGNAAVSVSLTDSTTQTANASAAVQVRPVASVPTLSVGPASGVPILPIPVPIVVGGLVDTDGSEQLAVTVNDPTGLVTGYIDAGGNPAGTPAGAGTWLFTAATPAALQTLLAGLQVVLSPVAAGELNLSIDAKVTDTAVLGVAVVTDQADTSGVIPVTVIAGAPAVFTNGPYPTNENQAFAIKPDLEDPLNYGSTYTFELISTGGTTTVDTNVATTNGVTITSGNGSADLILSGTLSGLQRLLTSGPGFVFVPTAYYSGDAAVALNLTAPNAATASATALVQVRPVASVPVIILQLASGSATIPTPIFVSELPDTDGSEQLTVTVTDPSGYVTSFTDSSGHQAGSVIGPQTWLFTAATVADLRTLLAGLQVNLVSAAGGEIDLLVDATVTDHATIDGRTVSSQADATGTLPVRVFGGAPAVSDNGIPSINEDQAVVVQFVPTDPLDFGDTYTVELVSTHGTATLDAVAAVADGVSVQSGNGTVDVILTGALAALQNLLTSGPMVTFTPDAHYGGDASLKITLTAPNGVTADDTVAIYVYPVASTPLLTSPPAAGPPTVPIAVPITIGGLVDTDGSEQLTVSVFDPIGEVTGFTDASGSQVGSVDPSTPSTWLFTAPTTTDLLNLLAGLSVQVAPNVYGILSLSVGAVVTDTAVVNGSLFSVQNAAFDTLTVTVLAGAPAVSSFGPYFINENDAQIVSFSLTDLYDFGGTYTVELVSTNGKATIDPAIAAADGVSIDSGNGTADIILSGPLSALNQVVSFGFTFNPVAYFSGDAALELALTAPNGVTASASEAIFVNPIASVAALTLPPASGLPAAPIPAPLTVDNLFDLDGSEQVTATVSDPTGFVTGFTDARGNAAGTFMGNQSWQFTGATAADLQALLAGLQVDLDPSAYGEIDLFVDVVVVDFAVVNGNPITARSETTGTLAVTAIGGNPSVINFGATATDENQSANVYFTLSDPQDFGAGYTLHLLGTHGTITVDAGEAAANGATVANGNGTADVTLTGTLSSLSDFVNSGSPLVFTPDAYFSGDATFDVTLTAPDGLTADMPVDVPVYPIASIPTLALPPATGVSGSPIPVPLVVGGLVDTDGSEQVTVTVFDPTGQVIGFTDSGRNPAGTLVGFETWQFAAATTTDLQILLAGLQVHLGPSVSGEIDLTVDAGVVDTALIGGSTYTDTADTVDTLVVHAAPAVSIGLVSGAEGVTILFGPLLTLSGPNNLAGDNYTAVIQVAAGTLSYSAAVPPGLAATMSPDGASLTLIGTLADVQAWLGTSELAYVPSNLHFSGEIQLSVSLSDTVLVGTLGYTPAVGSGVIQVTPVVSEVVAPPDVVPALQSGLTIPLSITPPVITVDTDGSEAVRFVRISGIPAGVQLSTGTNVGAGVWDIPSGQLAGLTLLFDGSGFHGNLTLTVTALDTDSATYPTLGTSATDTLFGSPTTVTFRYVAGGITAAVGGGISGQEATPVSLAGAITLSDPDVLPGDTHTLVVGVTGGSLQAVGVPAGATVASDPTSRAVTVTGDLDAIQAWLSSGGLVYLPESHVSGETGLTLTLTNDTADGSPDYTPAVAAGVVQIHPVAASVVAPVAVLGPQAENSIPLTITVPPVTVDTDGSEAVSVVRIGGVPAGVSLSAGTFDASSDAWIVPVGQLPGLNLMFAGTGFAGPFTLSILAVVTDHADFPTTGTSETVTAVSAAGAINGVYFSGGVGATTSDRNGTEGSPTDLAGLLTAVDPDAAPDETDTVTLTVSSGRLLADTNLFLSNVLVTGSGSGTVSVSGPLAAVNTFLATSNALRYEAADSQFAGGIVIAATAANDASPLADWTGQAGLRIAPVASHLIPSTADVVAETEYPVSLGITVPASTDPAEVVQIFIQGVPVGASFNHGTPQTGGIWELAPADLGGLVFTSPAAFSGKISLTVGVVVTDSVTYSPLSGSATDTWASPLLSLSVNVSPRVTISPLTLPGGEVGYGYAQAIGPVSGVGPYTLSVTELSSVPGITVSGDGTDTITVVGTPTASGTVTFTVTPADAFGDGSAVTYTIPVTPSIALTPTTLPGGEVGYAYAKSIIPVGGAGTTALIVSNVSAVPGVTVTGNGTGTVTVSGTPTAAGAITFTVTPTDAFGPGIPVTYTIPVAAGLTLIPTTLPGGEVGFAYSRSVASMGGTGQVTLVITASDTVPGLTVSGSGTKVVTIAGTPTVSGVLTFTVTPRDAFGDGVPVTYGVPVAAGMTLTPTTLPGSETGFAYTQTITPIGGTGAVSLSVAAITTVPGVAVTGDGTGVITISGTPTTAGTVTFLVVPHDAFGDGTPVNYTLPVAPGVSLAPTMLPSGEVGYAYSQAVKPVGGTGAVTLTLTRVNTVAGLTVAGDGTNAIRVSGMPTADGTLTFTVIPRDAFGDGLPVTYTVSVAAGLALDPTTLPAGEVGFAYFQSVRSVGGTGPVTLAVSDEGDVPGITITDSDTGTIVLSGPPITSGTVTFTITPQDAFGSGTPVTYTVLVAAAPALTPKTLPAGEVGYAYSQSITTTGGAGSVSMTLDNISTVAGLTVGGDGTGTIIVSGTPTTSGMVKFAVTTHDAFGPGAPVSYSIPVAAGLALTPTILPGGEVGQEYAQVISSVGGTGPVWFSLTEGTLVPGLVVLGEGTGTIAVAGTPTASGTMTFSVTPRDAFGDATPVTYTIPVAAGITLTPTALPGGEVGVMYARTIIPVGGSGPVTLSFGGLTTVPGVIVSGNGTGTISVTGTPATPGSVVFSVTAHDAFGDTPPLTYTIAMSAGIALTPVTLPGAEVGEDYRQDITSAGGSGPVTLAVTDAITISGLDVYGSGTSTITLKGTPTSTGTVTFRVTATDASGATVNRLYTVPVGSSSAALSALDLTPLFVDLTASGGASDTSAAEPFSPRVAGVFLSLGSPIDTVPGFAGGASSTQNQTPSPSPTPAQASAATSGGGSGTTLSAGDAGEGGSGGRGGAGIGFARADRANESVFAPPTNDGPGGVGRTTIAGDAALVGGFGNVNAAALTNYGLGAPPTNPIVGLPLDQSVPAAALSSVSLDSIELVRKLTSKPQQQLLTASPRSPDVGDATVTPVMATIKPAQARTDEKPDSPQQKPARQGWFWPLALILGAGAASGVAAAQHPDKINRLAYRMRRLFY